MTLNQTDSARLRWRCRRGMLELDALLQPFFDRYYQSLSAGEQRLFANLLEEEDPQLFRWLMARETPADAGLADLIEKIRQIREIR